MAINYTRMRALAERLIEENGRDIQLIRQDQGNPVDPAMPWRASTEASEVSITVTGVLIPFETETATGTIVRRQEQTALIAAKSVDDENPANTNIEDYDELLDDDGTRYRIEDVALIKPGSQRILYMLKVKQ
jgi:hypothetical protein